MTQPGELSDDPRIPVVPFVPFRCARCGADKPFTFGVRGRMRWHRCKDCNLVYKSREVPFDEILDWKDSFKPK